MSTTRYARVGMGARGAMYYQALIEQFSDASKVVAFCNLNQGRADLAAAWARNRVVEAKTYNIRF